MPRPHPASRRTNHRPGRPWQAWRTLLCHSLALAVQAAAAALPEPPPSPPPAAARQPALLVPQVLAQVNQYRVQLGLAPWLADAALTDIALDHSRLMAQRGQLGHDGFELRFARARRMACVENLAAGFAQASAVLAGWQASPPHHANLLQPSVRLAGIAEVGGYITLLVCE